MERSILVPLDGSVFGEHALPLALSIARRTRATVQLAHVHVPVLPLFMDGMPATDIDATLDEAERAGEHAYLQRLAERLQSSWDMQINTALLDAPITDALCRQAQACGADLIALATHGRGGLSRLWLGSIADELIRRAPLPLLIVRPHEEALDLLDLRRHEQSLQRILIALDGSPLAERAIDPALALGNSMQAEYTLIQAIDTQVIAYAASLPAVGIDDQLMEQQREAAKSYLADQAARLAARGLKVATAVTYGPPASSILKYAQRQRMDLIALATHGRSGLQRALLGSVADKVVRAALTPVLLCRPGDAPAA